VDQHALPGDEMRMFEECLPSGQRRKWQRRGLHVRDAAWLQSQVGCPHGRKLGGRSVTREVSQAVYPSPGRKSVTSGAILYHARDLVPRNARDSWRAIGVLVSFIPGQFRGRDASGVLQQDIPAPKLRQRRIFEK
jgi:hypothetical protein